MNTTRPLRTKASLYFLLVVLLFLYSSCAGIMGTSPVPLIERYGKEAFTTDPTIIHFKVFSMSGKESITESAMSTMNNFIKASNKYKDYEILFWELTPQNNFYAKVFTETVSDTDKAVLRDSILKVYISQPEKNYAYTRYLVKFIGEIKDSISMEELEKSHKIIADKILGDPLFRTVIKNGGSFSKSYQAETIQVLRYDDVPYPVIIPTSLDYSINMSTTQKYSFALRREPDTPHIGPYNTSIDLNGVVLYGYYHIVEY
jgi:hypothetical protein